jgi:uncharacterized repeat protein (TIGR03803 family)
VPGRDGNLYGRTSTGGPGSGGTIFRISPSGDSAVIFAFNTSTGGSATGALLQASDGNLYGRLCNFGHSRIGECDAVQLIQRCAQMFSHGSRAFHQAFEFGLYAYSSRGAAKSRNTCLELDRAHARLLEGLRCANSVGVRRILDHCLNGSPGLSTDVSPAWYVAS